jgi:hypothetical protein
MEWRPRRFKGAAAAKIRPSHRRLARRAPTLKLDERVSMFYLCSVAPPPVLTPERIDAMLSIMAEVCLESVVEAGQRQKAAADDEAFERAGRALQGACRNLRQTIAMKQRFDREEAAKAEMARKAAEGVRAEAEREHRSAVDRHHTRVRRHFERVLWNEYEPTDAQELFEDLDDRLTDLAEQPGFLDTPTETLIQRLADDIGLNDEPDEPAAPEPIYPEPVALEPEPTEPAPLPPPAPPDPPPVPPRPPDPPPTYAYPWEALRPGQFIPGGTGW